MSGLLSQAENYVSSSASSLGSSISSTFNSTVSNLLNPPGPVPLAATATTSTVSPGYLVTFMGTDEMGNPIGYNPSPTPNSSVAAHQGGTNKVGIIQAYLPEMFDIGTYSHWAPLQASGDVGAFVEGLGIAKPGTKLGTFLSVFNKGADTLQAFTGYTTQIPQLSQMFWTGTDPLTFNLNLQINATYDAKAEVTGAVTSLLALTLPSLDEVGTFRAPGPSLLPAGAYGSQYNINLCIGGQWLFQNVLIQNVNASFDVLPTVKGDYISATVHVQVTTNRIYAKSDLYTAMHNTPNPNAVTGPGVIQHYLSKASNLISTAESDVSGAVSSVASGAKSYISNMYL